MISCTRVNVDFDKIDQSDRLKVYCTSVEGKVGIEEVDARFYEVSYESRYGASINDVRAKRCVMLDKSQTK